jgi:hypothetical protein
VAIQHIFVCCVVLCCVVWCGVLWCGVLWCVVIQGGARGREREKEASAARPPRRAVEAPLPRATVRAPLSLEAKKKPTDVSNENGNDGPRTEKKGRQPRGVISLQRGGGDGGP